MLNIRRRTTLTILTHILHHHSNYIYENNTNNEIIHNPHLYKKKVIYKP